MSKDKNGYGEPPRNYEVGYGKPPKSTQFKKGQSGNNKGRPKREQSMASKVTKVLNETVPLREGDRVRRMSKWEAAISAMFIKAMKGDAKAFSAIVSILRSIGVLVPSTKEERPRGGVLLIPQPLSLEQWEKVALKHQEQAPQDMADFLAKSQRGAPPKSSAG